MFRDTIYSPIDPIPEQYIATLKRIKNEPDYSLTCFGIAMLKSRIENYGGIDGVFATYEKRQSCLLDFIERVKAIDTYPTLCYYIYRETPEDESEFIERRLPEFREKKSISALVQNNFQKDCLVLYHETMNCVGIFVNARDISIYHLLMSFIPLYFPAIFKDHPLTDADRQICLSLSKKSKESFITAVKDAVKPYIVEFRKIQLGILLKGMHDAKINNALNEVNNQRRYIQSVLENYKNAQKTLHDYIVRYEGMKAVESYSEQEQELVDYVSTNPAIHNLRMSNTILSFSVATKLINYNPDTYDVFKRRGAIFDGNYRHNGQGTNTLLEIFSTRANRAKFMDHIFSDDPDLFVRLAGNYQLDFSGNYITTKRDYNYVDADPMYVNYIPNPHLKIFACLGGYEGKVINALNEGNYISAIELCVASAGSVDLDETEQTFRPFLGWLMSSDKKVIVTSDGTEMTPEEAMLWIIDKEKSE